MSPSYAGSIVGLVAGRASMANDIKLAASEDNPAEKKCGRKLGGQLITTPALSGKILL